MHHESLHNAHMEGIIFQTTSICSNNKSTDVLFQIMNKYVFNWIEYYILLF